MAENLNSSSMENGEKFIWDGTYENLKKFVANELKLLGTWKLPGDETKVFTSPSVCLKWQSKTSKCITLSGDEAKDVAKQLRSLYDEATMNLTTSSISVDDSVVDPSSTSDDLAEASVIELSGPENASGMPNQLNSLAPMSYGDEHKFIKDKLSDIETDMKPLESKFLDKALTLANDLSNLKKHCLENNGEYVSGLLQENASLKAENIALKDRLDTTCFALSDLTTKVKDLEK